MSGKSLKKQKIILFSENFGNMCLTKVLGCLALLFIITFDIGMTKNVGKSEHYSNEFLDIDEVVNGYKQTSKLTCSIRAPCGISLPQHAPIECQAERKRDTAIARMWYQITNENEKSITNFPLNFVPWLNQTTENIDFYYATDPFESRYLALLGTWWKILDKIKTKLGYAFKDFQLYSYSDYEMIYNVFEKAIKDLNMPQYFGSYTNDPTYTDIISHKKWQDDDTFVQYLQTGICPWLIRKVTGNGDTGMSANKLMELLNPDFDFNKALAEAYGEEITIEELIKDERLFVLYHKEHDGLKTYPDVEDRSSNDLRSMISATSPITLMVLNPNGIFKVAAIQWDYKTDSPVYTPKSSSHKWLLAKGMVTLSHQDVCQFKYHLGHMHFVASIFCLSFRRHFSKQHPLYEILKYHCEGTTPHISKAYRVLATPESYGHILFGITHVGVLNLTTSAYRERKYGMFDFPNLLKSTGLDDERIKYDPFKEDGKLLWEELDRFSSDFIEEFYKKDSDIESDSELQSYANEVSADGENGPAGSSAGKFIGFPSSFTNRQQLQDFLNTFLWYNVMHATVNYNLAPLYIPLRPSKLYNDETNEFSMTDYSHDLPHVTAAVSGTQFSNCLSHFRANRLMDYYDKVQDSRIKNIVWNSYKRLHGCVNEQLSKRNLRRKELGQLGMQYLMPKWLTNSIHI